MYGVPQTIIIIIFNDNGNEIMVIVVTGFYVFMAEVQFPVAGTVSRFRERIFGQ